MFTLVSKSTHPVSLVLSQNAQCFYISASLPYLYEQGLWLAAQDNHGKKLRTRMRINRVYLKEFVSKMGNVLLGRAWASPTVMWLTEASAMHYGAYVHGTFLHWLKSHRHATGTSTSLLLTCQLCFQVHNFCVNLHGFAFRKTLHISQDVICWQSWSNNNSKYGLVRRTYTIYYGRTRCFRASWPICFWQ